MSAHAATSARQAAAPSDLTPERIGHVREQAGFTQKELAEALGVSLWTVERLEAGALDATPHLDAIARATRSSEWEPGSQAQLLASPAAATESSDAAGRGVLGQVAGLLRPGRHSRPRQPPVPGDEPPGGADPSDPAPDGSDGLLGARIASARQEAGLTQRELGSALGVSMWTVGRIEKGEAAAEQFLDAVAATTGKPVAWLGAAAGGQPVTPEAAAEPSQELRSALGGRKVILASIALLVLIRFFTEVVHVLPRAVNFIDIPVLAWVTFAAVLRPGRVHLDERDIRGFTIPALLFLFFCVVSVVANPSRVDPAPALVFTYGFLGPIALYFATYRLWPTGQALSLSRLLVVLGLIEIAVVGLVDLPTFLGSQNPDDISGTFGENAYQLVFFLVVVAAILAGIFTFESRRPIARFAPVLLATILAIIWLAQWRALLFSIALTVAVLAALLGSARVRGVAIGILLGVAFLITLSYVSGAFPILRFTGTIQTLTKNPFSYASERLKVADIVVQLYGDDSRYIVTGTGPGSFSSRAWQTFALSASTSRSNVAGGYVMSLTGGRPYTTDVSDKYVVPRVRRGKAIEGSKALTTPYSSYASLPAEVGMPGLLVIVAIYVRALLQAARMALAGSRKGRPGDPLTALLLGSAAAFFLLVQMGFLDNWLEVTRLTFPSWALLAVATKEFRLRYPSLRI